MRKNIYKLTDFGEVRTTFIRENILLHTVPEFELHRVRQSQSLLMNVGMEFKPSEYPRNIPLKPKDGVCYINAAETAIACDLVYCEGFMIFKDLSGCSHFLGHGWCCTSEGHIVDPTCPRYQNRDFIKYMGVPIKKSYLLAWYEYTGYYSMLDGHHQGLPVGIHYDHPHLFREILR